MRITNSESLKSHGNRTGRRAIVDILEAGLQAADPYWNAMKLVRVESDALVIGRPEFEPQGAPVAGEERIPLGNIDRIFIFGAGKGIQRVARALEDALGDHLTGGHVIDKKGHPVILDRIGVTLGGHPVPDDDCVRGCERILDMAKDLTERDLVFTCVANGVSALLTMPAPGLSLDDVKRTTHIMQIVKGAPTSDLNPVRNHLDLMKGGRISRHIQPARAIHIISIDPGSYEHLMHRNYWLHNLPDGTTYEMAIDRLKRWEAWDEVPQSVRDFLLKGDGDYDSVGAEEFSKTQFRVFGIMPGHGQSGKVQPAMKKAEELGFSAHLLGDEMMFIEAKQAAYYLAEIAKTIERRGEPFKPPCALFTSGEMVVAVGKSEGIGGRNQEFALAAATRIAGSSRIVMASVDTDGTDGPGTQFAEGIGPLPCLAGGIADGFTLQQAADNGIDIGDVLARHDTTPALLQLKSGVIAEPNISLIDLTVALILPPEA
ncbi:MAG: glycerate kinase type-2 family protein [Chloroflexota bacterium]